ncbi:uncharacterized protein F5891DRAFT_1065603 [Suillus fuscotomentosus]|uniref:Uncharacterized protein n=1 Tax=Suillus fuscotomentosus TaxID=1912939 RepID=A0AAD4HEJ0_9AGAM|nr:uncharacterized protein F5891DRAFT_1065603 [Suillus fuscotomentosus]KAG1893607.1 hypothetical protein F5891DRAFT_1065603 [Suillus fuscotomentosus]
MVAENIQRIEKQDQTSRPLFEGTLKKAATTAILGSYETIISVLMVFALAMVSYQMFKNAHKQRHYHTLNHFYGRLCDDGLSDPLVAFLGERSSACTEYDIIAPRATSSDDIYDGHFDSEALQETVKVCAQENGTCRVLALPAAEDTRRSKRPWT